jgi:hypothetical protein
MKNALISPNEAPQTYISGYVPDTNPAEPIFTPIADSCRVAQVADQTFEVALPLFWTLCDDDVVADRYYYNNNDGQIYAKPLPPPPPPTPA